MNFGNQTNKTNQYAIYSESKYEGGSCISAPRTTFYGEKIAIGNNLKIIVVDNKLYHLDYKGTERGTDRFNYGGILGPQDVPKIVTHFRLSNGENLYFIMLAKDNKEFVLDHIKFRGKEFRLYLN